jgi:CCR4-NOT transcription complex subunit 4
MSFDNTSDSIFSEDEDDFCPLCCEEMDITDKNFKPCPCGYQICQFCYNNIRTNPELNGKCPACRRLYEDKNIEYRNITAEEWKIQKAKIEKRKREKKIIEKEKKDAEQAKRHHLAGMRVIQKNLVYVVGLNPPCSYDDLIPVLRSDKYFGQYGKINKIVINKRTPNTNNYHHLSSTPGYGVYVTFARKEDATKCIAAVDGSISDGKLLRAAHGTTKYCSSYLRGQPCPNPNCMFLHEPGEEADSYSRQDLSSRSANGKVQDNRPSSHALGNTLDDLLYSPQNSPQPAIAQLNSSNANSSLNSNILSTSTSHINDEGPALPATVSWAKTKTQPTFNHTADPIADSLSAFPSLTDALQQSKQTVDLQQIQQQQQLQQQQQQQQLQQLLEKSQLLQKRQQEEQQQQQQSKKKEKKDKDQQPPLVLDAAAVNFKWVCDTLKTINNNEISYSIDPKFKSPEYGITSSNIRLFHNFNLDKFSNDQNFGYFNTDDNKERLTLLTDSLLFSPFTRNYNYRAYVQALQLSQAQAAQAQASQLMPTNLEPEKLSMTPSQLEAQLKQQQTVPLAQNGGNVSSTQAFLQQRLMQQQQLKLQQQNGTISNRTSAVGTPIQQPPGLFSNNTDIKSNSQELLSQLMGKKVPA